ncbi:DUF2637 domain-containing protein [Streptomyces venezuelae]|uniref:DUF2637 domain-containing protein n=2 Tax=Streptomyces TaxID=1883 RepID=A0A1V4ADR3_9ACTN|nr:MULTISPECIES: DUF2637 domain-containing protein [Streptomyces]OON81623.1 hypothetical protein B1H18_05510 [Streptomyces tsukubensis]QES33262.1 DUF2637 domain-containing protein [Streptomyces venezuelae]QFR96394.1 DUF2637 domain-containing protein [Streptomyces tsukubensis]
MNRKGRITLVIGLVAVVLMAFRVSWNALSDVARAIGADSTAALLYPIVVDGLMALALIATLVLTGPGRKFALRVLAAYAIASLLLNYVHGLIPALHTTSIQQGRLTDWDPANWALVLLATSLPVGSIYFGSDLVAKVLHHTPESADPAETASAQPVGQQADESAGRQANEQAARSASDQAEFTPEQLTESTPLKVAEAPVTRPTETDESAPALAPAARPSRSAAVPESTGTTPRRATGRVPATRSTTDRTRTDAEVLDEARLLTAAWSEDQLTAERLRNELRIGQKRARVLRDQLQAERRTGRAEPVAYYGFAAESLEGLDEAASQQQGEPNAPGDDV